MGPSGRAPIRLRVMPSEKVVEHMTRVSQKISREGRPVFGEQSGDGLEGPERFFPRGEPNLNLLFAVV